jgi:hypothetical protein
MAAANYWARASRLIFYTAFIMLLALLVIFVGLAFRLGALSPIAGGIGAALYTLLYSHFYPRMAGKPKGLLFQILGNAILLLIIGIPTLGLVGHTDMMLLTWLLALIIVSLALSASYLLCARFLLPRRHQASDTARHQHRIPESQYCRAL